MANYYDGLRSFNAVKGATAWPSDVNKFQDDMILGLEAREIAIPIQMAYHNPAETSWAYIEVDAANPPYWQCSINPAANEILMLPLPQFMSDARVIEFTVVVDGDIVGGDASQGSITLWERVISIATPAGGAPAAGAVDIGGATPWVAGGANPNVWTSGAIAFDVVKECEYCIQFQAGAQPAALRNHYIYGAYMDVLFHKGT